ncbi:hypothetical protein CK507_09790 [Pseudomonas sp. WN033]|nr:hypothetical protein CK507_09790 [Pseudomonas sp. WN033]
MRGLLLIVVLALTGCGAESWLDHRGNAFSRADMDGRWLVVNYWAEWCAPCLEELPELNALAEAYPRVMVLGIHFDRAEGEALRELSEHMGIEFPVMGHDFAEAYGLPLPQVLPTTYILNGRGQIVHSLQGPQDEAGLLALLSEPAR